MTVIPNDERTPSSPITTPDVTRRQVLGAVRTAVQSMAAAPWRGRQDEYLLSLLREALAASERGDDGTEGRAAPAIRAACAYLAVHQREDTYLALLHAQEQFGEL